MTSRNEITGDMIVSKTDNQDKYASGWDRIFGKKKDVEDVSAKQAWKLENGSTIEFSEEDVVE